MRKKRNHGVARSQSQALSVPVETIEGEVIEAGRPGGEGAAQVFSFGDTESVLDRRELSQYFEIWQNGRWYEPPLPMGRLAQVFNVSPYHRSAVALKVNLLVTLMTPSRWLNLDAFERFAQDFIQMGNAYLEGVPNAAGRIAQAAYLPAVHTRAGVEDGVFWWVNCARGQEVRYAPGSVFQLQQPDVAQEIYGLPEWLGSLQSALLSENATLFRRRYYLNGNHAGFIFYLSEPLADPETAKKIEEKLASAKGVGNFKNLFVNIPKGKKDGIQIIPVGNVTAHDEFTAVKDISRDDMLAAHRTPPQLVGIIPKNNGGFGSVSASRDVFFENECLPIMRRMLRANDWAQAQILGFGDYVCADGAIWRQSGNTFVKTPAPAR
jgi:PBSX family phage portal protein